VKAIVVFIATLALALPGYAQTRKTDVNRRNPDGSTPLQWAVFKGDVAEAKRLLRAGANVALANDYGATPMTLAAEVGNADMLKVLLEAGANPDSPNPEGQTALLAVARTGNVEAAQILLQHGATVDAKEKWGGQTPLMWASARRHPKMMELLIAKGADVNARSIDRDYQRHIQAEGRPKSLDSGGLTPLMYAARENCIACVDVLLAHKVDINLADRQEADRSGRRRQSMGYLRRNAADHRHRPAHAHRRRARVDRCAEHGQGH
jgi:ankyrin repeat protein